MRHIIANLERRAQRTAPSSRRSRLRSARRADGERSRTSAARTCGYAALSTRKSGSRTPPGRARSVVAASRVQRRRRRRVARAASSRCRARSVVAVSRAQRRRRIVRAQRRFTHSAAPCRARSVVAVRVQHRVARTASCRTRDSVSCRPVAHVSPEQRGRRGHQRMASRAPTSSFRFGLVTTTKTVARPSLPLAYRGVRSAQRLGPRGVCASWWTR